MVQLHLLGVAILIGLAPSASLARTPVTKDEGRNQFAPEVQVIGVYEGTYPLGVRHRFGFHPNGAVTVKVAEIKRPVVLVLTSYEPVVWKIEAPNGAVVRVIASGYHKQTVEGLAEKVPVTLLSYEGGDKDAFIVYRQEAPANASDQERKETKQMWDRLVERVKELTKHDIKELTEQDIKGFQGKYAAESFEVK